MKVLNSYRNREYAIRIKQGNQVEDLSDPVTVSSAAASQATCALWNMDRLPWKAVPDIMHLISGNEKGRDLSKQIPPFSIML